MITLKQIKDPYDLELGLEVKVTVRPMTHSLYLIARKQALTTLSEQLETEDNPPERNSDGWNARLQSEMVIATARNAILSWTGVFDDDTDKEAECTPETITALLSTHWVIAEAFNQAYNGHVELAAAEKKPSPGSSDG